MRRGYSQMRRNAQPYKLRKPLGVDAALIVRARAQDLFSHLYNPARPLRAQKKQTSLTVYNSTQVLDHLGRDVYSLTFVTRQAAMPHDLVHHRPIDHTLRTCGRCDEQIIQVNQQCHWFSAAA